MSDALERSFAATSRTGLSASQTLNTGPAARQTVTLRESHVLVLSSTRRDEQMNTSNKPLAWWSDDKLADALRQRQAAEEPTDDEIRPRAYEIYLSRNGAQGDALSDWLEAQDSPRVCKADE